MMSYGHRVDISGRSERKYSGFDSAYNSIPNAPLRKQSSIDKNNQSDIAFVRNNLRPAKPRIFSERGTSAAPSFEKAPKSNLENEKSDSPPRLRSRFTRNLSMSSRTKKQLNRRSMPSFKINEEGGLEDIDLFQIEENFTSQRKKQHNSVFSPSSPISPNSVLSKDLPIKAKSLPPVPPRTSSRNFQNRALPRPSKTEDTLSVTHVRRVASFPEAEAPAQKSPVSSSAFDFSPPTATSSTQSLNDVGSPQGPSPGTSPVNRLHLSNESGGGLSRQRSQVLRRKVRCNLVSSQ